MIALKSHYLFVVDAKPFPTNQNVKYEYFRCTFHLFYILSVVYFIVVCDFWLEVVMCLSNRLRVNINREEYGFRFVRSLCNVIIAQRRREVCQIWDRFDDFNKQSRGSETSRDLAIRRIAPWSIETLLGYWKKQAFLYVNRLVYNYQIVGVAEQSLSVY